MLCMTEKNNDKIEKVAKDKLGIYVTPQFAKEWRKSILPKREYSPEAAGAMLAFMDYSPNLQKELIDLAASNDVVDARKKAKQLIRKSVIDDYLRNYLDSLAPEERSQILQDARRAEEKIQKKK